MHCSIYLDNLSIKQTNFKLFALTNNSGTLDSMGSNLKPEVSTQASTPHSIDSISEEDPVIVTTEGMPQYIGIFRLIHPL